MAAVELNQIEEFFKQKRIAIIGLSRDPKDYTRNLFLELKRREYDVIPVNPNADMIEEIHCFKSVKEITPAPEAAMIFTVKAPLETLVNDCIKAGINHIWIHNHTREKEQKDRIYKVCKGINNNIIIDFCPFMFLAGSGFVHKFHGFCLKITGNYPKTKEVSSASV